MRVAEILCFAAALSFSVSLSLSLSLSLCVCVCVYSMYIACYYIRTLRCNASSRNLLLCSCSLSLARARSLFRINPSALYRFVSLCVYTNSMHT